MRCPFSARHRSPPRGRFSDAVALTQIRTVAETGSTNDDLRQLAADGAPEGLWLRAERQTGGRGRSGRSWVSPPGNLYASTLVRLRADDPPAPTLALVAGVALFTTLRPFFRHPREGGDPSSGTPPRNDRSLDPGLRRDDEWSGGGLLLKWPNDLLVGMRKLAGILLERVDAAVIVGVGVNLSSHPVNTDRPATSLADAAGIAPPADVFLAELACIFAAQLAIWRNGVAAIRTAWLAAAHPVGTPLTTHGSDGDPLVGRFDGLDPDGACRLRLADGGIRLIHAGDLFLA